MATDLTARVIQAYSRIEDPRVRLLVSRLLEHLHGYVKEVKLSNEEFEYAWDFLAKAAARTGPARNEFILLSDVLGVSQLVETLNHEEPDQPVGCALVGPFYRADPPFRQAGAATMTEATSGPRVRVSGRVTDREDGSPLEGAVLDIWQAATNGLYENQDENQPDDNLRGRFRTDRQGVFEIVALMPTAYHVPTDGPVGELLQAAKRAPYRPAHIHLIVSAPGHETLVTQIFVRGGEWVDEDVVFTASENMVKDFRKEGDHFMLHLDFPLKRGPSKLPKAPVPSAAESLGKEVGRRFVGTWRLVRATRVGSKGQTEHPYGENPVGYITYTDAGTMSVQMSRRERGETRELAQLARDYNAYFGRYEVDPERELIRHHLEGELFPGGHGAPVVERKYRFDGDLLWLTPMDGTRREILWQRVKADCGAKGETP